jgi:hypothetical protein
MLARHPLKMMCLPISPPGLSEIPLSVRRLLASKKQIFVEPEN